MRVFLPFRRQVRGDGLNVSPSRQLPTLTVNEAQRQKTSIIS
jgi:hypothetical protein